MQRHNHHHVDGGAACVIVGMVRQSLPPLKMHFMHFSYIKVKGRMVGYIYTSIGKIVWLHMLYSHVDKYKSTFFKFAQNYYAFKFIFFCETIT